MKRLFTLIFFVALACKVTAQPADLATLRVVYKFTAKNFADRNGKSEDLFYLDMGRVRSAWYSFYANQLDSAKEALTSRGLSPEEVFLKTRGMKSGLQERIVKNFSDNYLIFSGKILIKKYFYKEDLNVIEWTLLDDTLTVGSYLCNLATCNFRGREWRVWYTPEIPSPDGPWKLNGLPGLILQAVDSKNEFSFEFQGIMKIAQKVSIRDFEGNGADSFISTNGKTYIQIKRKSIEDIKGSIVSQGMTIVSVVDEKGQESQIPKRIMNSIEEY